MMSTNSQRAAVILLFFLSGFCNLLYEIVWARMFNLVFGVTVFAVSAVLAAFMLGLATGGIIFGRFAEKNNATLYVFSLLHFGIFLSAVVMLFIFPVFQTFYCAVFQMFHPGFYPFRIIVFFLSLLLMIVPTTLMGATFPAAVTILAGKKEKLGRDIGVLYSVNTLGSVFGCVTAIFFLLGVAGMKGTIWAAAVADLLIGLAALTLSKSFSGGQKSLPMKGRPR
jgi:spermidine synthase